MRRVVGMPPPETKNTLEYACGHKIKGARYNYLDKDCPRCRKKIQREREEHRRSLPYYLKTDTK